MPFSTLNATATFNSSAISNIVSIDLGGQTTEALDSTEITDSINKFAPGRSNLGTCTITCRPTATTTVSTLQGLRGDGPSAFLVEASDGEDMISCDAICTDVAGPVMDGNSLAEMTLTFQLQPS